MNEKSNNEKLLVVTILGAFVCMLIANWVIERMIERPFLNHINFRNERFNSPPNIIFLTSGIILLFSSLMKLLIKCKYSTDFSQDNMNQSQQQQQEAQKENQAFETSISAQIETKRCQHEINEKEQAKNENFQQMHLLKVSLPKFVEITCFLYGIGNLGFSKMLFLSILLKLVIGMVYEVIFRDQNSKCIKVILITSSCFAYGCFSVYSQENSSTAKISQTQIIYGYLYAFGVCVSIMIRKIFNHNNQSYLNLIPIVDSIIYQAKINLMLSFLLCFYLKEEIYGSVFGVLHYQFMMDILILAGSLYIGALLKAFLRKYFSNCLAEFMVTLQKCITIFISLIYSCNQISKIITLSITLMALVSFADFYLQLISNYLRQNLQAHPSNSTNSSSQDESIDVITDQKIEDIIMHDGRNNQC